MPTTTEPVSASSPPFILDSDMLGVDEDPDFEFLNSGLEDTSPLFSDGIFATNTSQYLPTFGSPDLTTQKSSPSNKKALLETRLPQPISAPSTASPADSYRDSSSDSSGYKRKTSSESSRSVLTSGDTMMGDDLDMGDWKVEETMLGNDAPSYGTFDGTINPATMTKYEFSDKTMENDFDFESAASSPNPFGAGSVTSPEMAVIKQDTPKRHSPMLKSKFISHDKRNSVSQN